MRLAVAGLVALFVTADQAGARIRGGAVESIDSRDPGEPIMAIVSLPKQRITVQPASRRNTSPPSNYFTATYQTLMSEDNRSVVISVAMFAVSPKHPSTSIRRTSRNTVYHLLQPLLNTPSTIPQLLICQ